MQPSQKGRHAPTGPLVARRRPRASFAVFTPKMAINAAAPLIPDKSAMKTAMREALSDYSTQR